MKVLLALLLPILVLTGWGVSGRGDCIVTLKGDSVSTTYLDCEYRIQGDGDYLLITVDGARYYHDWDAIDKLIINHMK
jgi:hypothetical protein